jgi:hypothetical protein
VEADRERAAIRRDALGIAAYAAAFGASFGAVSVASGLSVVQTCALSVVMFTGASQFAFVGVVGGGGPPSPPSPRRSCSGCATRSTGFGWRESSASAAGVLRSRHRW